MTACTTRNHTLLEVQSISKAYPVARSAIGRLFDRRSHEVLKRVSLRVGEGDVVGIVGESGSGKTTLANLMIGLIRPTAGEILFQGKSMSRFGSEDWSAFRNQVQMVFQGTQTSLNPRKSVSKALQEAYLSKESHKTAPLDELMDMVHLPRDLLDRMPHELSGGQRQRLGIARALARSPRILLADEPTSALDVSVQKEIIDLLQNLQTERRMTMLVISHDLGLIANMCKTVVVMSNGEIVERGDAVNVLSDPQHDYTRKLIAAVPKGLSGRRQRRKRPDR